MSSKSSSSSTSNEDLRSAMGSLLAYCELQDKEISRADRKIFWLTWSQLGILIYLIFI